MISGQFWSNKIPNNDNFFLGSSLNQETLEMISEEFQLKKRGVHGSAPIGPAFMCLYLGFCGWRTCSERWTGHSNSFKVRFVEVCACKAIHDL